MRFDLGECLLEGAVIASSLGAREPGTNGLMARRAKILHMIPDEPDEHFLRHVKIMDRLK